MRSQKGLVIGGDPRAASRGELSAWESPSSPSESGDRGRGGGGSPWEGQPHQYPCFLVMGQAGVLPTSRALSWRCLGFLLGMGREKKPKVQQRFKEGGGPLYGLNSLGEVCGTLGLGLLSGSQVLLIMTRLEKDQGTTKTRTQPRSPCPPTSPPRPNARSLCPLAPLQPCPGVSWRGHPPSGWVGNSSG